MGIDYTPSLKRLAVKIGSDRFVLMIPLYTSVIAIKHLLDATCNTLALIKLIQHHLNYAVPKI